MWSFVFIGAIVGHLVTLSNFLVAGGWFQDRQALIDEVVNKAVIAAIKECVLDIPKSPPVDSTPPVFEGPHFSWSLEISFRFCVVWIFGVVVGIISLKLCGWCCPDVERSRGSAEKVSSPGGSPSHIGDLAKNQLAELRLRRNEPQRAIRAP